MQGILYVCVHSAQSAQAINWTNGTLNYIILYIVIVSYVVEGHIECLNAKFPHIYMYIYTYMNST